MKTQQLPEELRPLCTLEDVGAALGVSYQMAWKLERSAINKLRRLKPMFLDDLDIEIDARIARAERKRRERDLVRQPDNRKLSDDFSKKVDGGVSLAPLGPSMPEKKATIWTMFQAGKRPDQIAAEVKLPIHEVKCLLGRMRA